MSEFHLALAATGLMVLVLGLLSRPLKRLPLSAPLLTLAIGIALGPQLLDWLNPRRWGEAERILALAAEITLAIGLMGVALRIPPGFIRRNVRSLGVLLALVMPLMALASGLLAYAFLEVPLLVALIIGAVVTPTDPIVATAVVTGRVAEQKLPEGLRHTLSAEAGSNDGLALPLMMLPLLLLTRPEGPWSHWLLAVVLGQVGGALVIGALLGWGLGRLLTWAEAREFIEIPSMLAYTVALSLLALGSAKLLHASGLLAVFVAGIAFDRTVKNSERHREEKVQEAFNQFFTLPIFALFGLMLPWDGWARLGITGTLFALVVLLLRRLPALLLTGRLIPALPGRADRLFFGWFGPIGAAALLYALHARRESDLAVIWDAASLVVFASLVAHGISASPFTRWYGRRAGR